MSFQNCNTKVIENYEIQYLRKQRIFMSSKQHIAFIILLVLIPICFVCDLLLGSILIPFDSFLDIVCGTNSNPLWQDIILNLRLPKAIAAVLVGVALPVSGLLMQTMFRNPLADPYVLGVSTGASLGVALFSLAGGIVGGILSSMIGTIGIAVSALIGATIVILIILVIAPKVTDAASLLIIGIMFGSIAAAIVSVLQYFSNPSEIHSFVLWTMGSLANIDYLQLAIIGICVLPAVFCAYVLHKPLDALLLGEKYAYGLGVHIARIRFCVIAISAVLAGIVTAFAGPIGFIGMTVPHIARFVFKTSQHKILILSSAVIGINLMLICDLLSQMPGMQTMLPINTVTAIFGAPIVIFVIFKSRCR